MKIAFFNYLPLEYGGGLAKYYIEVSQGLKIRYPKLDIHIVTFNENIAKLILKLYSVYFVRNITKDFKKKPLSKICKNNLSIISYKKARSVSVLRKLLASFDVIYSKNDLLEASILKYLIKYHNLNTVIFGFHTTLNYEITKLINSKLHNTLYSSFLYAHLLSDVDRCHVLNSYDQTLLQKRFPDKEIVKIYNPLDFASFTRKAKIFKYPHEFDKSKFNILWVGRLNYEKGVEDLIQIIDSINTTKYKNKIVWNVVGEGVQKNRIINLKRKWGNVKYFGYISGDYIPSIYSKCNLYLSTSKFESFGYTALEAQCFGLPVISYNIHGINEIITNHKNGYLTSSLAGFEKSIIKSLINPQLKKKEVMKHIRKKFNEELIYKQLYNLFTK